MKLLENHYIQFLQLLLGTQAFLKTDNKVAANLAGAGGNASVCALLCKCDPTCMMHSRPTYNVSEINPAGCNNNVSHTFLMHIRGPVYGAT